jgi:hypothetical protein
LPTGQKGKRFRLLEIEVTEMTKNEAIQAAHHWQQRAEAAEKFAAGLELNLVAVIQRAEAAEGYLAELSPRYADIVAERAELETQNEKWRERAEAAEAKLAELAEDTAAKLLRRSRELG